jgi:hypothetical protein
LRTRSVRQLTTRSLSKNRVSEEWQAEFFEAVGVKVVVNVYNSVNAKTLHLAPDVDSVGRMFCFTLGIR